MYNIDLEIRLPNFMTYHNVFVLILTKNIGKKAKNKPNIMRGHRRIDQKKDIYNIYSQ